MSLLGQTLEAIKDAMKLADDVRRAIPSRGAVGDCGTAVAKALGIGSGERFPVSTAF